MKRSSLIRIILLAGIAAAFIIGPLLQLKWFSGDMPGSPYYSEPPKPSDFVVRKVDASAQSYTVHWPANRGDKTPALDLRIAPTDWFTAYSGDGPMEIREEGGSPKGIGLTLLYPSVDSPGRGSLCRETSDSSDAPDTLFKSCQAALAQLKMSRNDSDWNIGHFLRGEEKLPSQEGTRYEDRSTRGLLTFWVKHDKNSGEQEFAGWSCADSEAATRTEVLRYFAFPPKGAAECFRPVSWWARWRPDWFGYEQEPLYLDCQPYGGCSAYFFFQQRIVEIHYEYTAPREAAEARTALILSGWQQLERARRRAAPHTEQGTGQEENRAHDLAAAKAQLGSCVTLSRQAADWSARRESSRDGLSPGNAAYYLKASCRQVAESALGVAPTQPAVALPLLRDVIPALQQSSALQGSNRELLARLYAAYVKALEDSGQSESAEMLSAQLLAIAQADSLGSTARDRIHSLLQKALTLSHQQGNAVAAETRNTLFRLLDRYYSEPADYAVWLSAYQGLIDDIAASQGQDSAALLEPLRNLGWKTWRDGDFAALKTTADRLTAVMLAQPLPGNGSDAASEAARKNETGAFDAVFFYRNYGFHERRLSEASTLMAPLLSRLDKTLGPAANVTKAARFHAQEVQTGRPQSGPVGGGFLGY
ncbi:MAG: hypothetical protein ACRERR_03390 [Moraxellaceae bacterium]